MQHDHAPKKWNSDLLTPSSSSEGGLQAKYLVPCCCNRDSLKFDMKYDHVLKKQTNMEFSPIDPIRRAKGGGGQSLRAKCFLPFCCISDSVYFDMQHDHVLKKMIFDLLTTTHGSGDGGRGWLGVWGQNICYHFSAFAIPFNLICNMTLF